MNLGENNGNLSEKKNMLSLSARFPAISQNEKIFAWYKKGISHNESFLSSSDSQRAKQTYYRDK